MAFYLLEQKLEPFNDNFLERERKKEASYGGIKIS
jgi:hypothetical protein